MPVIPIAPSGRDSSMSPTPGASVDRYVLRDARSALADHLDLGPSRLSEIVAACFGQRSHAAALAACAKERTRLPVDVDGGLARASAMLPGTDPAVVRLALVQTLTRYVGWPDVTFEAEDRHAAAQCARVAAARAAVRGADPWAVAQELVRRPLVASRTAWIPRFDGTRVTFDPDAVAELDDARLADFLIDAYWVFSLPDDGAAPARSARIDERGFRYLCRRHGVEVGPGPVDPGAVAVSFDRAEPMPALAAIRIVSFLGSRCRGDLDQWGTLHRIDAAMARQLPDLQVRLWTDKAFSTDVFGIEQAVPAMRRISVDEAAIVMRHVNAKAFSRIGDGYQSAEIDEGDAGLKADETKRP